MAQIKTIKPTSVSQAFHKAMNLLEQLSSDGDSYFWFRGSKDCSLQLLPGAYWRKNYEEISPMVTFAQEAAAYTNIASANSWETYCLAQHHGIPTRLLDWTESFSAALFFALDGWKGKTTPCVWVMKPAALNLHFTGWEGVFCPSDNYSNWLPEKIAEQERIVAQGIGGAVFDNDWPIAIFPKRSNVRVAAQQGTFTVHGRINKPLDLLFKEKGGNVGSAFAKIELTGCNRQKALNHLRTLGVRRNTIYPGIDSLVIRIQEDLEW